jgi:hypothetical protein
MQYEAIEQINGDYYGNGFKASCIMEGITYELYIFSEDDYINDKNKISVLDEQINKVLEWVKSNEEKLHKDAVTENYDWLFDELICDSDYYIGNGKINIEDIVNFTYLSYIKIFSKKYKIKSLLLCYEEKEDMNAQLLGGNTFGLEVGSSKMLKDIKD